MDFFEHVEMTESHVDVQNRELLINGKCSAGIVESVKQGKFIESGAMVARTVIDMTGTI